jgi:DNA-binding transcriptional regulator LsrR (DeoR family)
MSGGITMYEMIAALPKRERNITIYPAAVVGSGPVVGAHMDPNIIVTLLWEKSGRRKNSAFSLSVPVHEVSERSDPLKILFRHRRQLLSSPVVRHLFGQMNTADVLFTGIGPAIGKPVDLPFRSTAVDSLISIGIEEQWLADQGMLADINYAFFDADGNTRRNWSFFVGIGIDEMKHMASDPNRTVALTGGHHKKQALEAALRGRLCNVLITDDLAARYLIYGDGVPGASNQ